jgi:glycosyltransferase involved in cell wall biosynthesis
MVRAVANEPQLSVVIPVRNRAGLRLENCLRSLRWQDVDRSAIEIVLSDFGSDEESLGSVRALGETHGASVFHTPTDELWNRSRALNIGIQHVNSRWVLCTDADMVFAENFLSTILSTLQKAPKTLVHCDCLDLPEDSPRRELERTDLDALVDSAIRRSTGGTGACQAAPRDFFFDVRGYDEKYQHWGNEDLDMTSRAVRYGLEVEWISKQTYMLHQWHESTHDPRPWFRRPNYWRYVFTRRRVVKNPQGWGTQT